MTAPRDLTAIVESVARSEYERARAALPSDHPASERPWETLPNFGQYAYREHVLPIVTATIRAIDQEES